MNMSIKQPFTELNIKKQEGGFYHDNSLPMARGYGLA